MSLAKFLSPALGIASLCLLTSAGCGQAETQKLAGAAETTPSTQVADAGTSGKKRLLPASISNAARSLKEKIDPDLEEDDDIGDDIDDAMQGPDPTQGSPEWLIREATKLKFQPPPQTEDVEKLRAARRERNEKIASLAQQAIALTHNDKDKERLMNVAVHHMMEARLQLAMLGERADIDALYEDAAALKKRDPNSQAAAEAAYTLVNFAYSQAKHSAKADPRWLREFARQAIYYAQQFPKEEPKSLPLVFTAARSCELHGMTEEAAYCYALIGKNFPKSPYARRVAGILRRIKLPGNPPQLSGPTITGGHVAIDDLKGRVVMVVFWSTEAKPFEAQLPALLEVHQKYAKRGLSVIGVNLDTSATPVTQFLVRSKTPWPQIFFPEAEKQGWNNPIANFYGVMDIPSIWLIDQQGKVVSTTLTSANVEAQVAQLLGPAQPAATASKKK